MSSSSRVPISFGPRNIQIFNGMTGNHIGGLFQAGSITNGNFLSMLGILIITEVPFTVSSRLTGQNIQPDNQILSLGDYDIHVTPVTQTITVNNEPIFRRIISHNVTGREECFTEDVRLRDKICCFSGDAVLTWQYDMWEGWEAAHIFPVAKGSLWNQWGFGRWITNGATGRHLNSINSIQNGFLIGSTLHKIFDHFRVSANPDDGYKITTFIPLTRPIDGRILELVCRDPNDPNRISDNLLRWHFRQSILVNMRGAGEPSWDDDFPPGRDVMRVIRSGPLPEERMEAELWDRLAMLEIRQDEEDWQGETRSTEIQQVEDDEECSQDETSSIDSEAIGW
ncbi:hypothetical protein N7495_004463 [Penicillium taxi]|uniref:uncharacterized protein n=1 Tax=Penicillium taxi TaxID=168475 RepID=UPI00254522CA|nr:uncharacterized protein N7495_004463 [Penicillium taxi]KAJ5899719.1 hypothetical protein N7495_004463 [Penicillium taxi]